jgi:homoserine kinase
MGIEKKTKQRQDIPQEFKWDIEDMFADASTWEDAMKKALELGDEKLLRTAMQDALHQPYRKKLIPDYDAIAGLVRTAGAAFCLSGAGPTLLCITRNKKVRELLEKRLEGITTAKWEIRPLHVEFQGAHIVE